MSKKSEWDCSDLVHVLLATAPDRVIWYRLQPLGPDRLRLLTTVLLAPEVLELPNYEALRAQIAEQLTTFHLEDMHVCAAVQRGFYGEMAGNRAG